MKLRKFIVSAFIATAVLPAVADYARDKAADLIGKLTIDEKISLLMDSSPAIERLNIPQFNWWSEALHGVARAGRATVLPQTIGMAATFDDNAVYEAFEMVSDEARAKFNDFRKNGKIERYQGLAFWTPNVNIFRDPRWGRGQETYGEDPVLTSRMGVAVVKGLQGNDPKYMKTLAGAKHYAVHSGPEWNRHSFNADNIDPRDLRETYLPAFKALVDAGVAQVMCAYNRFEDEPCCTNKKLLTQILRDEWGYNRVVVTDCWALRDLFADYGHKTHPDGAAASSDAILSGTDLECGPVFKNLKEAYNKGLVKEENLNRALMNVLTERFRLGEIDAAPVPWDSLDIATTLDTKEHRQLALDMARKSMTLLKNDGILPLDKKGLKVMVVGPNAEDSTMQWGNYNGFPEHTITILEGIRKYYPDAIYTRGCDHAAGADTKSVFNGFQKGMTAKYWNNTEKQGKPVAKGNYTTPLSFDTGGATVFAPGVNLTNFSALYEGSFVAPEDGDYIIDLKGAKGTEKVFVNGKTCIERTRGGSNKNHSGSYLFSAKKGEKFDIALDYVTYEDPAVLKFDIRTPADNNVDFSNADIVIFVGGISPKLEGEEMNVSIPGFRGGDRETIELPNVQRRLVKEAVDAGKKVVFVNCSGSAVALTPENEICSAILQAWYPGQAGGQAVAEVLFGDYNPAGRLPVTFYKDDSQLPDFEDYSMPGHTYRYFDGEPLYHFGHGLSYTTFKYGTPVVASDGKSLSVDVTNSGALDGDEVVQLYMYNNNDPAGPRLSLRDFKRVPLKKGETVKVTFPLEDATFATYDPDTQRMKSRHGEYRFGVGPSSAKLTEIKVKF